MNNNLTEMVFILDRSGSMGMLEEETIGGFNSMIEKQKAGPGEAHVTTVLFDNEYYLLHDAVDIKEVKPITKNEYYARGTTALYDAIGKTIDAVGERLAATPEEERPGKVIFVITTDGYENASKAYSLSRIKEMIEYQKSKYSWVFMFLAANMDAEAEAQKFGIDVTFSHTHTANSIGTQSVYTAMTKGMSYMRNYAVNADEVKRILNDEVK